MTENKINKHLDDLDKEIAELKERIEYGLPKLQVYCEDIITKEIAELKEQIVVHKAFHVREAVNNPIEEVLREFIKHHKKHDSEDWYDDDPHIKELNDLLDKLDGEKEDSARHIRPYSNLSEVKPAGDQSEISKPSEQDYWSKKAKELGDKYIREEERDCNKCDDYGECDHQGAYQKDGKWCYE